MMMYKLLGSISLLALSSGLFAQAITPDTISVSDGTLIIQPVTHATLVLDHNGKKIYVDPTGGAEAFKGILDPFIILITDIHGDHFDLKTLQALNTENTTIVAPKAVMDKMPADFKSHQMITMNNGETSTVGDIAIQAIPMYNLPEAPDAFHTKGRGNGYVLAMGGKNIYISGDTEDIPEMRGLKNIDIAFVCMNLPYTMDVTQAAQGVLAFKPKIVYPYHYRGQDTDVFKKLVNDGDPSIEVRLKDWYPKQ